MHVVCWVCRRNQLCRRHNDDDGSRSLAFVNKQNSWLLKRESRLLATLYQATFVTSMIKCWQRSIVRCAADRSKRLLPLDASPEFLFNQSVKHYQLSQSGRTAHSRAVLSVSPSVRLTVHMSNVPSCDTSSYISWPYWLRFGTARGQNMSVPHQLEQGLRLNIQTD
jgi:hypothetical protein